MHACSHSGESWHQPKTTAQPLEFAPLFLFFPFPSHLFNLSTFSHCHPASPTSLHLSISPVERRNKGHLEDPQPHLGPRSLLLIASLGLSPLHSPAFKRLLSLDHGVISCSIFPGYIAGQLPWTTPKDFPGLFPTGLLWTPFLLSDQRTPGFLAVFPWTVVSILDTPWSQATHTRHLKW